MINTNAQLLHIQPWLVAGGFADGLPWPRLA